ncbi:response regulator receiver modulated PAS/PAC sensor-containing diguanylate cyclase/phosphodiesterase [Sulfuricella denitrificans skB26]|uniref:Response regulator receiver modulated PAS/PAC sensor-containing diguanylate cyclase/phosphodiesterase n=1 Tax=Sulfuricella denitrificans (strain DSM 22764 / NBRC 105220 / skB26) TaxID=1163617 RepID=S6AD24_SULDS|nr:EAL domain-containing protein [Sulfuricella denitrificans]BAN36098.1 response regulator receiver modulated PAS/PAC sensor-containing diguanylate cyclase/phosphodiesterase [Sulfuricella denitrificans skB26]
MTTESFPASQHSTPRLFAWQPLLVFGLLACTIGGTGFFVFSHYQQRVQKEAHETLGAIADLRVRQVEKWRDEFLNNAEEIVRDPMLAEAVEHWLQRGASLDPGAQRIVQRLKAVQQAYDFQAAFILDERGVVRNLPITPHARPPTLHGVKVVMEAMRTRQAILTDLHEGAEAPRARMDLVVPLLAGQNGSTRAIAAIYFRIDPQRYLFPLLQSWPSSSTSAEAMLLRREGDEVVVMNNLRHRDNTALQLRFPVAAKKLLAAMVVRGEGGLVEGVDYRGIPVIGAAREVPDSPWFLVVKMDKEELYAPIHSTAWILAALTFAFIAGAGVLVGLLWRQQRMQFLARQYEDKLRHQALIQRSEQQTRLLLESAAEAIYGVNMEGLITFANPACLHMLGYEHEEELLGRHAHDLFHHSHADGSRYPAEKCRAYEAYLADQGVHVDNEVFWRKDGTAFPVEYWSHPIHHEGRVEGSVITFMDITERKQAEQQLRLAAQVFEGTQEAIFITDAQNHIVSVNQAFIEITGYDRTEAIGQSPALLKSGRHSAEFFHGMMNSIRRSGHWQGEIWNKRKNGEIYPAWMAISTVCNEQGDITHYVAIYTDISELKRSENQLERQANYDELTGLANRNLFQDRLNQALIFSRRHDYGLAILFIDLDNFKNINDSLGHDTGDALLAQVATRLTGSVREGDTVARHGGDEFVLLLSEIRVADDVSAVTQKLLKAMSAPFNLNDRELHVTCSIGIASYPKDGEDKQTLLKNADAAMYRAKELGRNNAQYYAEEMNIKAMERLTLENCLYQALERNEFLLHYQPQVDLRTGEITGMEALVRWQHPELGLVSPSMFIPVVEDSGMIISLGEWVLRTACLQNKAWQLAGLKHISVAVNLSARQFRQPNLVEMVTGILRESGLDPSHLDLEVTESLVMQNVEATIATLGRLKAMGIKLSIDDFGTGYSSLNYLKRFPIHTLKIDKTFINDITTDPNDAAIAKTIISMAHELGLMVIAEGVETEEQRSFLHLRNCDEMQGYLFSRPVSAEEFEILLRERSPQVGGATEALGQRTLLLLDDEENILTSLTRLLHRDGYRILKATNAATALDLLAKNLVGVIISDQRMPEMTGVEFLRRVKRLYPETVRIVLSGYTDLKSVTDAINEGSIYKFFTKPWDDDLLRANVQKAFQHYELAQGSQRLTEEMTEINEKLNLAKHQLEMRVEQKTSELQNNAGILQISQEIFEHLSVGIIGVDGDGLIAVANSKANEIFDADRQPLVGSFATDRLPSIMIKCLEKSEGRHGYQFENGCNVIFWSHSMGASSGSEGQVLVIVPNEQG